MATPKASIGVPALGGVQNSMMNYGVGILAGVGYNVITKFTGSGLIGGAVAAAVTGAAVRGVVGEMIAVNAGFVVGSRGLQNLGLGNLIPGLGGGGGSTNTVAARRPQFELI